MDGDLAEADVAEKAFALLDGLRAAGGFDVGTAMVVLSPSSSTWGWMRWHFAA